MKRSQAYVDYERVAALYRRGRALAPDVLSRWKEVVGPYVPPGASWVLDIGAGTGIFAKAWPQWAPVRVLAVEPAEAMVGAAGPPDSAVAYARAVAEALPVRDDRADVVWVSAALHHFFDMSKAAAEFRRALRGDGRVMVRTYVPGRTEVSWAFEFPNRAAWERRFQTEDELVDVFAAAGLALLDAKDVLEWTERYAVSADWVSMMRHADSVLTALSDEEIAEGLAALRAQPDRVGRLELTLLVFART